MLFITVPNLLTSLRIVLTPLFVIYIIEGRMTAAMVVFVIAGISDGADGFIARVYDQKSRLGSYLDPLADKILLVAAFITLAARDYIPAWLTVIAISRDVLILLGVLLLLLYHGSAQIRPSIISKVTTCLQLATVFFALAAHQFQVIGGFIAYLFWSTSLLTIISGLHYMHYWFKAMGQGNAKA
jgi:cardiolipin synthase